MGGSGRHVWLEVSDVEMDKLRGSLDRPAINFVTVLDVNGKTFAFNTGEVLAIVAPGSHCLYEDQQDKGYAMQLFEKEAINLEELRRIFGLGAKGCGRKKRKAGL
jgi:hypothetical protein